MKQNHWAEAPVQSVDEGICFFTRYVLLISGFFQCDWPLVCQIVSVGSTFIREVQNLWNNKMWKQFSFKYSLLLRSRLLSNTVHSQLKTTAWLLPERHGSTRCSNNGSYVCPVHSHQLPWGVFGTFWPVGNVGREGLWPTEETKGISQMVKSS